MPVGSNVHSSRSSSTASITDKAAQLISNLQSKFQRRNAVRYKVNVVLDHKFEDVLLKEPTYCSQCHDLIWGLIGQSCKLCKLISHKKCLNSIDWSCTLADTSFVRNYHLSHSFKDNFFFTPTICNHCGILLKGVTRSQGLECDTKVGGCGMSVHRECKLFVGFECKGKVPRNQSTPDSSGRESYKSNQDDEKKWSRVSIKDFDLISIIGTGSFSKVYLGKLKTNGQEFAIKVIKKTNLTVSSDPESALTEKKVLNFGRQYPFLTIAHCCFQSKERLYFVMEHVAGRDLLYHICKARKFTEDRTRFYAAEIVLALRFLHRKGVIYRDLKLENVILDEHGHCKLLDFGMSKELSKTTNMKTRTFCGTPSYISPEIIQELDYGFSVDWWSLGVLMYEMIVGYSPFEAENDDQLYRIIVDEEVKYPKFISDEARSILEGLLTKDPHNRLGCHILEGCDQAILEHAFFKFKSDDGIERHEWDAIESKRIKPPYRPNPGESMQSDNSHDEDTLSPSPLSPDQLRKISQEGFAGFSFYSASFQSLS